MTLLKKFSETGQEIGSEDVPVTPTNFPDCIEQYGTDWAKGYAAALADFKNQIYNEVLTDPRDARFSSSPQVAGRLIKVFYRQKLTPLSDTANQLLSEPNKPDNLIPG